MMHFRQFPARLVLFGVVSGCPSAQSSAVAEGVVVPAHTQAGDRFGLRVFHSGCSGTPIYTQILFTVPESVPNPVRAIAFRRRDWASSPAMYPPITVDVEIMMGHSPRTPASFSHDLPENRGADFQRVMRRQVSFPSSMKRADNQYPFAYRLPLDTPFSFRAGGVGVIEFRLLGSTLCLGDFSVASVTFDGFADPRVPFGEQFGVACSSRFGAGRGNNLTVAGGMSPGNPSAAMLTPPPIYGSNVVRFFGGLRTDQWAGLPLPYHLAGFGAKDCWLYISLDWEWPQYWRFPHNAYGHALLDLPNDPNLVGLVVYVQGLRLDPYANALGIETSQAWRVPVTQHKDPPLSTVVAPEGLLRLDGGQRHLANGPVFELSGQ